jgi:hypothetical protein
MPPRLIVVAILIFWIAATAWLFQRDLWPNLRPDEPPPYTIDLADEARQQALPIHWNVLHGEKKIGQVQTSVSYRPADDTFDMQGRIGHLDLGRVGLLQISANRLASTYTVTRTGELRELLIEGTLAVQTAALLSAALIDARVRLEGKVEKGYFIPYGEVEVGNHKEELQLEPVEVSSRGSILNPLHPVNRIVNLRPGQHWRTPLVDPLADSLSTMVRKNPALEMLVRRAPGARELRAEVLAEPVTMRWEQREVPCLVIEYRRDDFLAHTWVRASDGLVLRQEASVWGERIVLERE